jgi:hypothetical protein
MKKKARRTWKRNTKWRGNMLKVFCPLLLSFESSSFVKARLCFYYSRVLFYYAALWKKSKQWSFRVSKHSPNSYTIALFATKARHANTRKKERQQPESVVR